MTRVIDTNVPLVARRIEAWPEELIEACEILLEEILDQRLVVTTDVAGEIVEEYLHKLSLSGRPSVGDEFAKYVFDHRFSWGRDALVDTQPGEPGAHEYGVLNGDDSDIDPSDRKFVAAAKAAGVPVVQASDTKWLNWVAVLARHGVVVRYAHEDAIREMYRIKFGKEAP